MQRSKLNYHFMKSYAFVFSDVLVDVLYNCGIEAVPKHENTYVYFNRYKQTHLIDALIDSVSKIYGTCQQPEHETTVIIDLEDLESA